MNLPILIACICFHQNSFVVYSSPYTENSNDLVYISNDEGLLSHFRQLQEVWSVARNFNRSVSTPFFQSDHFQGLNVSLCNVFELPKSITCLPMDGNTTRLQYNCSSNTENEDGYFDFRRGRCFTGYVHLNYVFAVTGNKQHRFQRIVFAKYYQFLSSIAKDRLGLLDSNGKLKLIVVHWRRGDQLGYRCDQKFDTSVNCKSTGEFIHYLQNTLRHMKLNYKSQSDNKSLNITQNGLQVQSNKRKGSHKNDAVVYVATNERNQSSLKKLQANGFKVFRDLNFAHLNQLDRFVVELTLVCSANVFLQIGYSEMRAFSNQCRSRGGH